MGDFTGFTFGDWHSTDPTTGLVTVLRVSGGDRYEDELQPDIKDITAEVPGLDGEYYFGSNYGSRKFEIDIAFDSLTEKQFRELRAVFGTRKLKQLIFDERPYKKYMAKIDSPMELSYVCFDEPKKSIGAERDGVRRDRENDSESITVESIVDTIIIPGRDDEEEYTTLTFTLTHNPADEVVITPSDITYDVDENTYTFINYESDPINITLSYNFEEIVHTYAWEKVTLWTHEEGTQRIYKGEGKINFICYFPFAKSIFKQLPFIYEKTKDEEIQTGKKYFILDGTTYSVVAEPSVSDIEQYYERVLSEETKGWAESSRILSVDEYEKFDEYDSINHQIKVYNAGDILTGCYIYLPSAIAAGAVRLDYKEDTLHTTASLVLKAITMKDESDIGVLIDTNNELILGVSEVINDMSGNGRYTTSGNLYNEFVEAGYFFKLEPNVSTDGSIISVTNGGEGIEIFYDYLYF